MSPPRDMENEAIVPQTTCGSAVSSLCVHVATQALYYRARTPALRNTIARLGWRIDSHGHGGYVVAAGSQLPEGPYRRLDDRAPLPQWLTDLLSPLAPLPVPRSAPVVGHPDAYVQAALVQSKRPCPRRLPRGAASHPVVSIVNLNTSCARISAPSLRRKIPCPRIRTPHCDGPLPRGLVAGRLVIDRSVGIRKERVHVHVARQAVDLLPSA
ncbi:bifunctional DNA primase/polymerase [Nocardia gipuzkoensis]|uniref:bifunctional DNA primase/polymerase n=1 Tax=Nocardia gipuzkoensis TaxID=2749991 RepID=UPI0015EE703D